MSQPTDHQESAQQLLDRAHDDPLSVLAEGRRLAEGIRASGDDRALSTALRALGLAARLSATLPESIGYLEDSVTAALAAGDRSLASMAAMTLAGSLALAGRTEDALTALDEAGVGADTELLAQLDFQRGSILARMASPGKALDAYARALHAFRATGDTESQAEAHHGMGMVHAYGGDLDTAEAELLEARVLYGEAGRAASVAFIDHNLGLVAAYRGDLPRALSFFDESEERLTELTGSPWEVQVSRCEALLSAGLFDDAHALAGRIARQMADAGLAVDEAEATLVLAQAALLAGDAAGAEIAAGKAAELFDRQGRGGWSANARLTRLSATVGRPATEAIRAEARSTASELEEAGQFIPAASAHLLAGRLGLALGDLHGAESDFGRIPERPRSGPVELRVQAWLAKALIRRARGNLSGADAAARAGLRTFESYQAALGATDVRIGVAQHAEELAELGLGLAVASRNPGRIWSWMERTRARALWLKPVKPPRDGALGALVADLRRLSAEIRNTDPSEIPELRRRQVRLQEAIRRRSHHTAGDGRRPIRAIPRPEDIAARLGDRQLIEFTEIGNELTVVMMDSRAGRVHGLGPMVAVEAELHSLRLALRRMAREPDAPSAKDTAEFAARRRDDLLLAPLGLGDGPCVIAPPARLHALPWSLLPSCRGRPVSVAPSAELWLRGMAPSSVGEHIVLAAGPDVPHASVELRELSQLYPGATRFSSRSSNVRAVLDAVDGARLVHVASHGMFRTDNPLFSALQLADGDLTVYDLEGLDRAPETIVLSSCDSGLSSARPGEELMGIAGALFSLGTRTLIAGVGLVPDTEVTREFAVAFHRQLCAGHPPAAALARVQESVASSPGAYVTSASFVCFGTG